MPSGFESESVGAIGLGVLSLKGLSTRPREHMPQAAGPFRTDHSMGKVAVMHAKLRGWPVEESSDSHP